MNINHKRVLKRIGIWGVITVLVAAGIFNKTLRVAYLIPDDFGPKQKLKELRIARDSVKLCDAEIKKADKELKKLYANAAKNHEYEEIYLGEASILLADWRDTYLELPEDDDYKILKNDNQFDSYGKYIHYFQGRLIFKLNNDLVGINIDTVYNGGKVHSSAEARTDADAFIHRIMFQNNLVSNGMDRGLVSDMRNDIPMFLALGHKSDAFVEQENELIAARKEIIETRDRNANKAEPYHLYEDDNGEMRWYNNGDVLNAWSQQKKEFKAARKLESERNAMRAKVNSYKQRKK
ncbi:MAG: hypothetical protein FWC51_00295 [Proteobacteria bacterium]|nr:hypothetical protein [Pseudomonadota bacterium]